MTRLELLERIMDQARRLVYQLPYDSNPASREAKIDAHVRFLKAQLLRDVILQRRAK